ncbi:Do family serine endopeptidase [Cytophagaceae bacterium ABcell3]|nr:Do family serine endopeptidase [Cytophagaceae bacterium ABcell3]
MKSYITSGLVALGVSMGTVWFVPDLLPKDKTVKVEHVNTTPVQGAVYTVNEDNEVVPLDFTAVAPQVMDAVVHIKSSQTIAQNQRKHRQLPDPFREFFGEDFFGPHFRFEGPGQRGPQVKTGTGSGVIINQEGYIVTNNHVIDNADEIEVTLHDNRTYKASIVGTDPSTDLALIRIKESDLPYLSFVDSDDVKVGEWVLAVGNPFNLNSTVTAGIVSAKGRNINILQDQYAIESFIQTDAAINPGNSGGALVNLQGALIGINTAIASPTGAYAGYGFAVPSNMVNKVVEDLLKYGIVQRGYLGIIIRGVDGGLAKEKDLKVSRGVYVDSLAANSAAADAGVKAGDVILEINGTSVNSVPKLQEMIARHRPGDEVNVTLNRNGKEKDVKVKLKNHEGETTFISKERNEVASILGAEFKDIKRNLAKKLDIDGGVQVTKIFAGKLKKHTQMKEGFIITKVDGQVITSVDQLMSKLENKSGGVLLEGVYEDLPGVHYYAFGM